ncbi:MAG: alkaline phosphatase family protein [Agriterribacter sp.]
MKKMIIFLFLVPAYLIAQQKTTDIKNVIVITTDGLRWQEVFKGMDTALANDRRFNQGRRDSTEIYKNYWAEDAAARRKKLMPFFWNTIAVKGQIYGNREKNNKVNVANPHWFSYPGYNEIFTGYPDPAVNSNEYKPNPHVTVLEYINNLPEFKGRVAAFGAWEAFNRILNEDRCGFPVVAAYDLTGGKNPSSKEQLINNMLTDSYKPFGLAECFDVYTHYAAMEHLKTKKPRVLYIAYGETDEWAHDGRYRDYLDAAKNLDKWISDIWSYVQSTPEYKDKTAIIITCDHGRGDIKKEEWRDHGSKTAGSDEIWFAVLGRGIPAKGEVSKDMQLYQKQFAQTIASLLGLTYKADHPIGDAIIEIKN